MAERRSFLLRIDPAVLDAVQRWANDDLRSLNGQIEFLLRRVLQDAGRAPAVTRGRGGRGGRGERRAHAEGAEDAENSEAHAEGTKGAEGSNG